MIVKCIANVGDALPEACRHPDYGLTRDTRYDLTVGKEYLVLAITNLLGYNFFYVLEDDVDDAPALVPAPLFEVVDGRISRHWQYRQDIRGEHLQDFFYMLSFPEWVEDGPFLENLIDGAGEEVEIFQRQLRRLEEEFGFECESRHRR